MRDMSKQRIQLNVHKAKTKDGILPVSLCSKCGATKSSVFYKAWEVDTFSRADDDYLGILCKNCKNTYD